MMAESSVRPSAGGVARRRRERRLRSWWRHEQQTVRMALAAATHHSAQQYGAPRGQKPATKAREGEVRELHHGLRAQERPLPGTRPAGLAEPRGDVVQVQRHVVGGAPSLPTLVVPVPQMVRPAGGHPGDHCQALASCCRAGYRRAQDHPGFRPAALEASGATAAGGAAGGSATCRPLVMWGHLPTMPMARSGHASGIPPSGDPRRGSPPAQGGI